MLAGTYVLQQASACVWETSGYVTCSTANDVYYLARVTAVCDGFTMLVVEFIACYTPCTSNLSTTWAWTLPYATETFDCDADHVDSEFTHDSIIHGDDAPCGDSITWPTIAIN
jgi:hypothetical protein